jgi:hypothetical protein
MILCGRAFDVPRAIALEFSLGQDFDDDQPPAYALRLYMRVGASSSSSAAAGAGGFKRARFGCPDE